MPDTEFLTAIEAAGFTLDGSGGGWMILWRTEPDEGTTTIASLDNDFEPPTSLSEAVTVARLDADGWPVGEGADYPTLREALERLTQVSPVQEN